MIPINFCLLSESFENNGHDVENIYEKINNLDQLNSKIKNLNDKLFRDDTTIYYIDIFDGLRVHEFIISPDIEPYYKQKLRMILERHTNSYTDENIDKYVGFHKINAELISTLDELIEFYYDHIGSIHDEEEFFEKIKLHFPELEFRDEIKNTLKSIDGSLESFAKSIVKSLIHLRDDLKDFIAESNNLDEALKKFQAKSKFETTLEGTSDPDIKKVMTFEFETNDGKTRSIYCEPHIKFHHSEIQGDSKYYQNRLHFKEEDEIVGNGNILIGYIGKHLKIPKKKRKK